MGARPRGKGQVVTGAGVQAVDLFCGAGGMSEGLGRACERLGRPVYLAAVNHWQRAVDSHQVNHPWADHYCARVESLDPRKIVPGGKLDIIAAGVECTHHSRARGGQPMNDQSRASAWHVLHWAEQLRSAEILIENVPEFLQWGPIDSAGKPIPGTRGDTFRSFVQALESLRYRVEWRLLTCADYGDPTTRRRFFLRARADRGAIAWPEASHAKLPRAGVEAWRTAREIIDWSDLGESIFTRDRPLKPRTIARIAGGIRRFCGANAEPFLVMLYGTGTVRSLDRPVPTVTADGQHIALASPFFTMLYGRSTVASLDLPCPTVTAGPGHIALATPFLTKVTHGARAHQPHRPDDGRLSTVTTHNGHCLVTPFILPHDQFTGRNGLALVDSIDRPMRTVTAANGSDNYLVSPFIVPHFGEREGQTPRTHSLDDPCPTVTATKGAGSLVTPFLVQYNGTSTARDIHEPLGTVTTRDRFGLVTPDGVALDILFRMLKPEELAAAQGFPASYRFQGNKTEVVKQIGNAVPCLTAEALCFSALAEGAASASGEQRFLWEEN